MVIRQQPHNGIQTRSQSENRAVTPITHVRISEEGRKSKVIPINCMEPMLTLPFRSSSTKSYSFNCDQNLKATNDELAIVRKKSLNLNDFRNDNSKMSLKPKNSRQPHLIPNIVRPSTMGNSLFFAQKTLDVASNNRPVSVIPFCCPRYNHTMIDNSGRRYFYPKRDAFKDAPMEKDEQMNPLRSHSSPALSEIACSVNKEPQSNGVAKEEAAEEMEEPKQTTFRTLSVRRDTTSDNPPKKTENSFESGTKADESCKYLYQRSNINKGKESIKLNYKGEEDIKTPKQAQEFLMKQSLANDELTDNLPIRRDKNHIIIGQLPDRPIRPIQTVVTKSTQLATAPSKPINELVIDRKSIQSMKTVEQVIPRMSKKQPDIKVSPSLNKTISSEPEKMSSKPNESPDIVVSPTSISMGISQQSKKTLPPVLIEPEPPKPPVEVPKKSSVSITPNKNRMARAIKRENELPELKEELECLRSELDATVVKFSRPKISNRFITNQFRKRREADNVSYPTIDPGTEIGREPSKRQSQNPMIQMKLNEMKTKQRNRVTVNKLDTNYMDIDGIERKIEKLMPNPSNKQNDKTKASPFGPIETPPNFEPPKNTYRTARVIEETKTKKGKAPPQSVVRELPVLRGAVHAPDRPDDPALDYFNRTLKSGSPPGQSKYFADIAPLMSTGIPADRKYKKKPKEWKPMVAKALDPAKLTEQTMKLLKLLPSNQVPAVYKQEMLPAEHITAKIRRLMFVPEDGFMDELDLKRAKRAAAKASKACGCLEESEGEPDLPMNSFTIASGKRPNPSEVPQMPLEALSGHRIRKTAFSSQPISKKLNLTPTLTYEQRLSKEKRKTQLRRIHYDNSADDRAVKLSQDSIRIHMKEENRLEKFLTPNNQLGSGSFLIKLHPITKKPILDEELEKQVRQRQSGSSKNLLAKKPIKFHRQKGGDSKKQKMITPSFVCSAAKYLGTDKPFVSQSVRYANR